MKNFFSTFFRCIIILFFFFITITSLNNLVPDYSFENGQIGGGNVNGEQIDTYSFIAIGNPSIYEYEINFIVDDEEGDDEGEMICNEGKKCMKYEINTNRNDLLLSIKSNTFVIDELKYYTISFFYKNIDDDEDNECGSIESKIHVKDESDVLLAYLVAKESPVVINNKNQWIRKVYKYYPSNLGTGNGYLPIGSVKAQMEIVFNYNSPEICKRIIDSLYVYEFDYDPDVFESIGMIDTSEFTYKIGFNKNQQDHDDYYYYFTSSLSYGVHFPQNWDIYDPIYLNEELIEKVKKLKTTMMRVQLCAYLLWNTSPVCPEWDTNENFCKKELVNWNFDDGIYKDNENIVKKWVEESITFKGNKFIHYQVNGIQPDLCIFYKTRNYIPIDSTKFYEIGIWYYILEGIRIFDVTLHFYNENYVKVNEPSRLWGTNIKHFGATAVDEKNIWIRRSSLFYPTELNPNQNVNDNGYIPKDAKYVRLTVFVNYQTQRTDDFIDGAVFLNEFDHIPTDLERETIDDLDSNNNLLMELNPPYEMLEYNFDVYDQMITFIHSVGAEPWLQFPIGTWGEMNYLPQSFPLDDSFLVEYNSYPTIEGYFASIDPFKKFMKDNLDYLYSKYNVIYYGIGNEAIFNQNSHVNATHNNMYMNIYNAICDVADEISSKIKLSCDRSNYKMFMKDYFAPKAKKVGFLNIHEYEIWGGPFYPSDKSNQAGVFYEPNNEHGWMKNEYVLSKISDYSNLNNFSPSELKSFWKSKKGQDLELFVGELGFNSNWKNGTDHRSNDVIGAVWLAGKYKDFMETGVDNANFFHLLGKLPMEYDSNIWEYNKMYKYGGTGLRMILVDYYDNEKNLLDKPRFIEQAPYWATYLLSNYFPKGKKYYSNRFYSGAPYELIDLLVNIDDDNILLICKSNKTTTVNLDLIAGKGKSIKFDYSKSKLLIFDSTTFQWHYSEPLKRLVYEKSEIKEINDITSYIINENTFTYNFKGYSILVIDLQRDYSILIFIIVITCSIISIVCLLIIITIIILIGCKVKSSKKKKIKEGILKSSVSEIEHDVSLTSIKIGVRSKL